MRSPRRIAAIALVAGAALLGAAACGTTATQAQLKAAGLLPGQTQVGGAAQGLGPGTSGAAGTSAATGADDTTSAGSGAAGGEAAAPGTDGTAAAPAAGSGSSGAGATGTAGGSTGTGAATGGSAAGSGNTGTSGVRSTGAKAGKTTAAAPTAAATTAGAAAASSIPATGPGWTQTTVKIGVITQSDEQAAFAAVGYNSVNGGTTINQAQAMADEINAKGGLFGRKVVLVQKDISTVSAATNPTSTGQAACTFFSQDNPVIAVYNVVEIIDNATFRSCLSQAHIPFFDGSVGVASDTDAQQFSPYYFASEAVSWDKIAPILVGALKTENYFTPWNTATGAPASGPTAAKVVVGVLTDSSAEGSHISSDLVKALQAAGQTTVVYQWTDATQGQSNSVVQMESKGVTHVIADDIQITAFSMSANQQGWHPRYGISTYNDPYSNQELTAPAGQNVGSLGIGWAPAFDTGPKADPGSLGPAQASCLAAETKGDSNVAVSRLAEAFALTICDAFRLIAAGAQAGGGLSSAAITSGIYKAAPSFSPASAFAVGLKNGSVAVPGAYRPLAFDAGCSCFKYTGPSVSF